MRLGALGDIPPMQNEKSTAPGVTAPALQHNLYGDGAYRKKNLLWQIDESPFKVRQILQMRGKFRLHPQTICEVGYTRRSAEARARKDVPCLLLLWLRHFSADARAKQESCEFQTAIQTS